MRSHPFKRSSRLRWCAAALTYVVVFAPPGPAQSASQPDGTASADAALTDVTPTTAAAPITPPSEQEIRQAIRDLNHPSPARRREAVRRLADWGPLAFDALGKVAAGSELEPALLARDLLREMGEVLFVGGRVRLEVDRERIRWDEPFALTVHVHNPTPGPVVVPWPADAASTTAPAADLHTSDADQVAALMDIADHLSIVGPDGRPVELRVDPIESDSAVYRAVAVRAGFDPPSHPVPPQGSERLRVPAFNRGWARYPLLAAGRYTIRFAYQPEWRDPAWIDQGFGRIESNIVTIEVTQPAPSEVREATRPVRLQLRQENDRLVAELQNVWDRDLWFNFNLGGPLDTHARLEWCPQPSGDGEVNTFALDGDATGPQFAADRIGHLAPGQTHLLTRADPAAVIERARLAGDTSDAPSVALKYSHLPSGRDLRLNLREKGQRETIPSQIFSGSAISEPIPLSTSDR